MPPAPRCRRRRCRALERENSELRARIETLEAEIKRLTALADEHARAAKRQAAPFSKGAPAAQPKTPGRKPGAQYGRRAFRPIPEHVDETIEVPLPDRCPACGEAVTETGVEDQYQTDLPPCGPWCVGCVSMWGAVEAAGVGFSHAIRSRPRTR